MKIEKPLLDSAFEAVFFLFFLSFFMPLSSKAVNNIFYVGLALPVFVWMLRNMRDLPAIFRSYRVLIGMLAGFLGLAIVADTSSVKKVLYIFLYFATCLLIAEKGKAAQRFFGAFSAVACAVFLYLTASWLWQYQATGLWGRQVFWGSATNPVYASLLMLSALVFLWLFYLEGFLLGRARWQLLGGIFLLMCATVLCVLVFQARSALLGGGLFFIVYFIQRRLVLLGGVIAIAAGGLIYLSGVGHLLLERGLSYRTAIWEDAINHVTNDCVIWLGCGADEYKFLGQFMHPHSGYISTLYRYGIIGAGLFALFALVFFWRGWQSKSPWFLLALVGWGGLLTTGSGFFSSPQPLWVYFWFPTFMALIDGTRKTTGCKQCTSSA
ncbi:hypothetical protein LOY64_02655 [Pseudomonas corrugata]|uniref:O-antigen ligase family protein n=1 Tax=Pseudomonas corrugata TaxID=47879 RepID=UPI00222E3190|nr:hypothetical protein [Pseudomonas corrugata]UZD95934.1 hypothetical protein LOY64_02655 [Pseudomonas corrugata]